MVDQSREWCGGVSGGECNVKIWGAVSEVGLKADAYDEKKVSVKKRFEFFGNFLEER